jgi:predicted CxxxxCH...CXXCH cytochrome family protein
VKADGTIDVAGGHHLDGSLEAHAACGACHGLPPTSGAHARHATLGATPIYGDLRIFEEIDPASSATDYAFGCGHCHPLLPARHMDGVLQVELTNPAAPTTSIKVLSPSSARFDPAGKTCSDLYCHSSGQPVSARVYRETPPWDAAPGTLGCDGCHGNPPVYPNGGMGSDTANSHLPIGWSGHFGTVLPHGNAHANTYDPNAPDPLQRGAAFTCQVCHFESVDPKNTGPSGFYWLDVTTSLGTLWPSEAGCTTCHAKVTRSDGSPRWCDGVADVDGSPGWCKGRAWPLRHVNGRPDVVFDARQTLPESARAIYAGKPFQPLAPYWFWWKGLPNIFGPDVSGDGLGTSWLHVANASYQRYDANGVKVGTCSNVSCHLWEHDAYQPRFWSWGQTVSDAKCGSGCHYLSAP